MRLGVTFAPFTEDEWIHAAAWDPLYRVRADQAATVEAQQTAPLLVGADDWPRTSIADADAAVDALLPYLSGAWGIEPLNEPNGRDDPQALLEWYQRTTTKIRNTGWGGPILFGSLPNLNDDTLAWAQVLADALWPDLVLSWHGYDGYLPKIPALLALLNNRAHAMTESGYRNGYDSSNEQQAADAHRAALPVIEASGSLLYIAYQFHDGGPTDDNNDFGLHAHDGHWRPSFDVLQAYALKGAI